MKSFFVTTPIYYVNASPHLGHAYTTIVADAMTRFHKMLGEKTLFLTGTDEHGDKIVQAAEKNQVSPQDFVNSISARFRALWPALGVSHDIFSRTTDQRHIRSVQLFLQKVYDAGDIYFGEFGGHYCYGCERFYTEKELENGLCPQHLTKTEFISEKNYFFRMSRYLPWLRQYLTDHPDLIRPERYRTEVLAMLNADALEDLCISRPKSRLEWGIELPFDKNYVCYVWFDALLIYISSLGWPDGEKFREFWPGEHLVAKDILKPHAVFWPTMLKAAGLPIYRHLDVHGYWLSRDTKMSKSLGNVVDPLETGRKYGLDAFRYFLLREMNFGSDSNFTEQALIRRINADLANDLGNLFSRTLAMTAKFCSGAVPAAGALTADDELIVATCLNAMQNYRQLFQAVRFSHALEALWELVRALNKYVDQQAPWELNKKGATVRLGTVLNLVLSCLKKVAICVWPVMPAASRAMLAQLAVTLETDKPPTLDFEAESGSFGLLQPGTALAPGSNLFPRIERVAELVGAKPDAAHDAPKPEPVTVDFASFKNLDLRIGTVLSAEKHPNADRILVLSVDFGQDGTRQILSGIADSYDPATLPGRQVCALLNIPPRKIRGLVSHGMILTAENGKELALLAVDKKLPNGSEIA